MTKSITVAFPKTQPSPWLAEEIRDRVRKLEVVCGDILSCRAVVDIPHRHHQRGNRFSVRLELTVPGEDIAITRDANLHASVKDSDEQGWAKRFDVEGNRKDVRLVLGDTFTVAKRRLRDYMQRRRREVKRHEAPVRGFAATAAMPRTSTRRPARRVS